MTDNFSSGASGKLRPGLADFDQLPDSAYVRLPVVLGVLGIGRTTFYRWIEDGIAPAPVKFTPGCARWSVGAIRRLIEVSAGRDAA